MKTNGLLGKKKGMTQIFEDDGTAVPVTVIEVGPCTVVQVKTEETDGYQAVQLGYEEASRQDRNQPYNGHFEKHGIDPKKHLQEFFMLDDEEEFSPGTDLTVEMFGDVNKVDIAGTSKGKGFSGMVKRHNKSTGPKSHGSRCVRQPGAIGQAADPSRVFKGKTMSGQLGNKRKTVENLEVVRILPDKNALLVKGSVPGSEEGLVEIYLSKTDLQEFQS